MVAAARGKKGQKGRDSFRWTISGTAMAGMVMPSPAR